MSGLEVMRARSELRSSARSSASLASATAFCTYSSTLVATSRPSPIDWSTLADTRDHGAASASDTPGQPDERAFYGGGPRQ